MLCYYGHSKQRLQNNTQRKGGQELKIVTLQRAANFVKGRPPFGSC